MTHMLDDFGQRANRSIEAMKAAAEQARLDHAAAELVRHMLLTTRRFASRGRENAIEAVVADWLGAWHLERDEWPEIAAEMEALTGAFYDYCIDPSDVSDQAVREAWQKLKSVHDTPERTLEDQMAWRSVCAHGWWGEINPAPEGYRDHDANRPTAPFWSKGCLPECLG
ncbi:hypothetical protein IMCC20628_03165 [Hoeflea sp. IMCC20628]|uniref:hypothetical protein n=1 Tax=Hoeflea sp. IMCC20628 TaxID=1620421 RepID=UPI00063AFE22|nr:hypothetical protein [Hoeflea sp. IMCC20628]AKI01858.1 hypothetical protein IMCC20628_03165 [Hoeflea sp. IMCC20628]